MSERKRELVAASLAVATIGLAALLPFWLEGRRRQARLEGADRVVDLTAVEALGIWTEDPVTAGNYWRTDLRAADLDLEVNRTTLLRLHSADVVHTFYLPELEIGPVEVYPGRVTEVLVTPEKTGSFSYYCTTVCGSSHFAMQGELVVSSPRSLDPPRPEPPAKPYWSLEPPPPAATRVAWGRWHFEQKGCATCHGEQGRFGVANFNGMNPEVLSLAPLASNLFLFSEDDVRAIVGAIEDGRRLEDLQEDPPVPLFDSVLTQYRGYRDLVRNGRKTVPMNPAGPLPPLDMPGWKHVLSDSDIDSIFAYLLSANLRAPSHESQTAEDPATVSSESQKGPSDDPLTLGP